MILSAAFRQPWDHLLAEPCTARFKIKESYLKHSIASTTTSTFHTVLQWRGANQHCCWWGKMDGTPTLVRDIHKGRLHWEEAGGYPNADIVREVAWIWYYGLVQNADKGGGGSNILKILWTSLMYGSIRDRLTGCLGILVFNLVHEEVLVITTLTSAWQKWEKTLFFVASGRYSMTNQEGIDVIAR